MSTALATKPITPLYKYAVGGLVSLGSTLPMPSGRLESFRDVEWTAAPAHGSSEFELFPFSSLGAGMLETIHAEPVENFANFIMLGGATSPFQIEKDELLKDLRARALSMQPSRHPDNTGMSNSIDDAIPVVQAWPETIPLPLLDFDDQGLVVLDVISDSGDAVAGMDFLGQDGLAAYSIVLGDQVVEAGKLATSSLTELLRLFGLVESVLS